MIETLQKRPLTDAEKRFPRPKRNDLSKRPYYKPVLFNAVSPWAVARLLGLEKLPEIEPIYGLQEAKELFTGQKVVCIPFSTIPNQHNLFEVEDEDPDWTWQDQ